MMFQSLSGHTTPVECVCFGHSEDLVCAGSQTGALKIWDLEAAKLLRTFTGHKGAIKCMDFHPYGDYLTTGSCDSNIKLWDTRKRGCIVTYSSHRLAVNSLQFSPDGQWIASACEDGKNSGFIRMFLIRCGSFDEKKNTVVVTLKYLTQNELDVLGIYKKRQIEILIYTVFSICSLFTKQNHDNHVQLIKELIKNSSHVFQFDVQDASLHPLLAYFYLIYVSARIAHIILHASAFCR